MVVVGIVGPQKSGKKAVAAALQELHGLTILNLGEFASTEVESGPQNGEFRGFKKGVCSEIVEQNASNLAPAEDSTSLATVETSESPATDAPAAGAAAAAESPTTATTAAAIAAMDHCTYS